MKKTLALVFLLVLSLLLFAACQKDGEGGESTPVIEANPASDFEYMGSPERGVSIKKYIGTDKTVVIPDTIDGLPVTMIGMQAFYGTDIESVVFPNSVHTVGDNAFSFCAKLKTVEFGDGLVSIGNEAFSYCSALEEAILPSGLESLGGKAFYRCTSLEKVFIPNTLTTWNDSYNYGIFTECTSLKTIVFEEGLETIGRYATFTALTSLERLEIPASVKTIGALTFGGCPALTVVIFRGDAPAEVDEYLFGYQEFNENLVIYYDPATEGWDDIVWRGYYRLEPIPAE